MSASGDEKVEGPVFYHGSKVDQASRFAQLSQQGGCLWFTGLSGSGKSTLAVELEARLLAERRAVVRLDGDNLRQGLCSDLGFSLEDRAENMRRCAEVARLFCDAGVVVLVSLVSPLRSERAAARERVGSERFREIHVATSLEVCEQRDVKGLYAKARAGELAAFTGISSPFEVPEAPELRIDTAETRLPEATEQLRALVAPWLFAPQL